MKQSFLLPVLVLLCASATSQTIYKWTDEAGHVHYGDRSESPKGSAAATVNVPQRAPSAPAPGAANSTAPTQDTARAAVSDSPNLQRCLVMARAMADNKDLSPPTIRAQSQELLALCPGIAYDCTTYLRQPERNTCEVSPSQDGHMVRNRTYN